MSIRFCRDSFDARAALQTVMSVLTPQKLSVDDMATVETVVAEVMNNIVEHAYQNTSDGCIEFQVETMNGNLSFQFIDDGLPMPNDQLPAGKPVDLDVAVQDIPEGGFGWALIRELSKDLSYQRRNEKNHLSFVVPVTSSNLIR